MLLSNKGAENCHLSYQLQVSSREPRSMDLLLCIDGLPSFIIIILLIVGRTIVEVVFSSSQKNPEQCFKMYVHMCLHEVLDSDPVEPKHDSHNLEYRGYYK